MSRQNEQFWQDLLLNGHYICSVFAHREFEWANAGNSVILHIQEGDNLTLVAHETSFLYGSSDHIFTTFSGAEVVPDVDLLYPGNFIFSKLKAFL